MSSMEGDRLDPQTFKLEKVTGLALGGTDTAGAGFLVRPLGDCGVPSVENLKEALNCDKSIQKKGTLRKSRIARTGNVEKGRTYIIDHAVMDNQAGVQIWDSSCRHR